MSHTVCPHLNYLQHLCPADVSVPIQVVHAESPAQLLLQSTTRRHAQGDYELPEVDGGVTVGVKRAEDVLCKLWGVSVGEEVGVDLLELLNSQVSGGTVLEEASVPLLQLVVGELCVFSEVIQHLGPQLAVLFPHDAALSGRQIAGLVFLPPFLHSLRDFTPHVTSSSAPAGDQQPSLISLYG